MKSKSTVVGIGTLVVGSLVILGASFGLKAIGDNRSESSTRGAAASDLDFFDSDYCAKGLWTRVTFVNELPFEAKIASVSDVDSYDWCNSADGTVKFLPSDDVSQQWGLMGLALAPGSTVLRSIDPRQTSSGSPFTLNVTNASGERVATAKFDVDTLDGERGSVVFSGDEQRVMSNYKVERAVGAVIVNGQARVVVADVSSSSATSVITFRLG